MKKETSSNLLEKIDVAKKRIKELVIMINHWKGIEVEDFWDAECSINPSSQGCLLFNDCPSLDKSSSQLKRIISDKNFSNSLLLIIKNQFKDFKNQ